MSVAEEIWSLSLRRNLGVTIGGSIALKFGTRPPTARVCGCAFCGVYGGGLMNFPKGAELEGLRDGSPTVHIGRIMRNAGVKVDNIVRAFAALTCIRASDN